MKIFFERPFEGEIDLTCKNKTKCHQDHKFTESDYDGCLSALLLKPIFVYGLSVNAEWIIKLKREFDTYLMKEIEDGVLKLSHFSSVDETAELLQKFMYDKFGDPEEN